jgi:hypothetical protein
MDPAPSMVSYPCNEVTRLRGCNEGPVLVGILMPSSVAMLRVCHDPPPCFSWTAILMSSSGDSCLVVLH